MNYSIFNLSSDSFYRASCWLAKLLLFDTLLPLQNHWFTLLTTNITHSIDNTEIFRILATTTVYLINLVSLKFDNFCVKLELLSIIKFGY